ncbi:Hypothetical protein NCS54_00046400 [Fusarium falciforme]|uniref:Cell wall protein PhiA n=1 Tax=Fusarium falciforme TaxID=195108 RepID=A0A9W8QUK6_9HYPO|nr:Hypothetical protein NCS54_00046400 [Fusarium falciforme]KAJ4179097.1 hypothetical protein NW755_012697 [Fusarium falciforme]WAO83279.1 Hypothetical protein NCS54_00046400 [Fusarium falciforme]
MQIKSLLLAPLVASGLVTATPSPSKPYRFEALALRSATDIHFAVVQAAHSSIFLKLPQQKATCEKKTDNSATFSIVNGELFLYGKTRQQIYVDRSGMGQGKIGYTTGTQSAPRNAERKGWAIDKDGDLSFKGKNLVACPHSIDGAWSVWVSTGIKTPGGNKGCLEFLPRTAEIKKPISCKYTQ